MHRDKAGDVACRCGHARIAHEHYRAGSECALCPGCRRYRPPGSFSRLVAAFFSHPRSRS